MPSDPLITLRHLRVAAADPGDILHVKVRSGDAIAKDGIGAELGVVLIAEPGRAVGSAPRVMALGPGEWWVIDPVAERAPALSAGMAGIVASIGSGQARFDLEGAGWGKLIALGCTIDPHSPGLAPDHVARTLFAHIPVLIDRRADERLSLYCAVSLAPHLRAWLHLVSEDLEV